MIEAVILSRVWNSVVLKFADVGIQFIEFGIVP